MATRKEIQAAKKILAKTWHAANGIHSRSEKPFNPSKGSFERYIAWCDRHKIKPSAEWAFDTYYQTRYIRGNSYPSGAWPNSIEKMESLLGPGTPVHVGPDEPDYKQKQIADSWYAVLRAYEPGFVDKYNYDTKVFEKVPETFKTFSQQIHVEYSVFPGSHSMLHWEIDATAEAKVGWGRGSRARVKFMPGVAGDLNATFLDIVSICDCRKITRDEEKAMTFSFGRYTYKKKNKHKRRRWR